MSSLHRSHPSASISAILLALSLAGLPSCGGGGEEADGGSGGLSGGGDGGGSPGSGEPPPDLDDVEGFGVWPGDDPGEDPGSRLAGAVGYRNSPRLSELVSEGSVSGGTYRRTWFVHGTEDGSNIGEDFQLASINGRTGWLTVLGTPLDLSPHPEENWNEYPAGIPAYARYVPTDPVAWADRVIDLIVRMDGRYGLTPGYVEIWNEVERVEWFTGTVQEYLDFYTIVASRISAAFPEIQVGGPGLAGQRSAMDGEESVLFALMRHAAATGAPLDFVSWHHYAPGGELLYTDVPQRIRDLAQTLGLTGLRGIVSEWNVYPATQAEHAIEMDGAHGAANMANFLITAYERGLDGNMFFEDLDHVTDDPTGDLTGDGMGLISLHGVLKPSYRVMKQLHGMSKDRILPAYVPEEDQFSLRTFASRKGDRTRILVSNDTVSPDWVFANRSREHGLDPGWLFPIWTAAGGMNADEQDLIDEGLTPEQAAAVMSYIPEVRQANFLAENPTPMCLTILGTEGFVVDRVLRYDAVHNTPVPHQPALLPDFIRIEEEALWASAVATADYLAAAGYGEYDPEVIAAIPDEAYWDWAAAEGIFWVDISLSYKLRQDTLRDERLAEVDALNARPELLPEFESPEATGLTVEGRKLRFPMEPETVWIIELVH